MDIVYKMKKIIKSIFAQFTHKEYDIKKELKIEIDGEKAKTNLIFCSNVVVKIQERDNVYYLKPFDHYGNVFHNTMNCVNEFFAFMYNCNDVNIDKTDLHNFEKVVRNKVTKKTCKSFIKDLRLLNDNLSLFSDLDDKYQEVAKSFFTFVRINSSKSTHTPLIHFKKFGIWRYNRSKAVYELSKMLNINNLIQEPFILDFRYVGGGHVLGLATQEVRGISGLEAVCHFNGRLYRDLCDLDYLDFLCVQRDHWPHNLMVLTNGQNEAYGIKSFDNDYDATFYLKKYYRDESPYNFSKIVKNGYINRPYISDKLYNNIMELNLNNVRNKLSKYLTIPQIMALNSRIRYLKGALKRSYINGKLNVVKEWEWDDDMSVREENAMYGTTIANIFKYQLIRNREDCNNKI